MTFEVPAENYRRFMGRFSEPLAVVFVDAAGVASGQRALDVGCGPGALTAVLIDRLGSEAVSAVDPSAPFVAAAQAQFPEVDVRLSGAENLPYQDGTFDVVLAELVVQFMDDPAGGIREMGRVTRPGGTVGACIWDYEGGGSPLAPFWKVVEAVFPDAKTEQGAIGSREGDLAGLVEAAGLTDVRPGYLTVHVPMADFDDWWQPYTLGVGPAGAFVATLDDEQREELEAACRATHLEGPFTVAASAWSVMATAVG